MSGYLDIITINGGDFQVGIDYWGHTNMDKCKNGLMALSRIPHQQAFALDRNAYVLSASQIAAPNHLIRPSINWTLSKGLTARVRGQYKTDNVATSVKAFVRQTTGTPANVGDSGTASTATTWTPFTFTWTNTTGVHEYELQVIGGNATNPIYCIGVMELGIF